VTSQYPDAYDNLSERTDASPATPNAHAQDHTDERNAINAIESELGLAPSGASATVRARLDALDTTVAGKETAGVAAALVDDLSGVTNQAGARTNLGLGTAATKDVPGAGNASTSQVVLGTDTRLTDARTPLSTLTHASTHGAAGSDPITIANTQITGLGTASTKDVPAAGNASTSQVVLGTDTRLSDARTPSSTLSHASSHGSAGSDPISIANTQVSGLGTMSTQAASNVTITGGSVTGITDLAIADGGTGASTASGALGNLGAEATANKGVANGYASLDGTGKVPSSQLPTSSGGVTSVDGNTGAVTLSGTYQALDSDLTAVAGLTTNGLIVRTGTGTAATRTITGGTGLTVTNGDGVSGAPTMALAQNLQDIAGITRAQGDILTGGGSAYTSLAKGTRGTILAAGASSLNYVRHSPDGGSYAPIATADTSTVTQSIASTIPQWATLANQGAPTSGRITLVPIQLDEGVTITSIAFTSGTAAGASLTNQWFVLCDTNRTALAYTVNDTTTAWAASTRKVLALTSTYTTTYRGLYWLGILVTATTVPSFRGLGATSGGIAVGAINADSSLTTPGTAGTTTYRAAVASGNIYFGEVI